MADKIEKIEPVRFKPAAYIGGKPDPRFNSSGQRMNRQREIPAVAAPPIPERRRRRKSGRSRGR